MRNFQGTLRMCKPSYFTRFLICMTVPLRFIVDLLLEQWSTRVKRGEQRIPRTYNLENEKSFSDEIKSICHDF